MPLTVYHLAGYATIAWALLIVLPSWRVTRWIAQSAVFPVYLCVLYAIGLIAIVAGSGVGFMRDFGSAEGVLGLLARTDVALVAWIHILAFDQLVGLYIYRDNMRHRYVPLPLQSVILVFTFMLGPIGFLLYWMLRGARRIPHNTEQAGWTRVLHPSDPFPDVQPAVRVNASPTLDSRVDHLPSATSAPVAYIRAVLLREERVLAAVGVTGLLLGAALGVLMLVSGPVIEPEGVLSKPASFDVAIGIFIITLALLVPLARMPERMLRWWRPTLVVLTLIAYAIETVQPLRGLDPRFSQVAGTPDRLLGAFFFLVAVAIMVLFYLLAVRFFDRVPRPSGETLLALSMRYAGIASVLGFGAGFVMSRINGRFIGDGGNLLTLHALGFHGIQALPLVAILAARASDEMRDASRWVHAAGIAWMGTGVAVAIQTARGLSMTTPTFATFARTEVAQAH
jgi:hypothetical protein